MNLLDTRPRLERAAILRGGTIYFAGKTVPCIVRAISETGARLLVYSPDRLPATFRLFVEIAHMDVDCEVAWKRGKEVGVDFVGFPGSQHTIQNAPAGKARPVDPHRPADVAASSKIPILIAEDDPDDRMLIETAFRESGLGYKLTFVEDGEKALDHLAAAGAPAGPSAPALIILDLNMPKVDGRAVLRHLKSKQQLKRIPVIVFTTSNAEEDVESTYDLGISSYIVKPSHYDGLLEVVQLLDQYWGNSVLLPRQP
ncbi:MAG: response regulator [Hyphomicrobiaceae bacterium]